MEKVYFLVSSLEHYVDDAYGFHSTYFASEGAFVSAFVIAVVCAVLVAAIFYFGVCNFANRFSKHYVWSIALLVSGVLSVVMTDVKIVGSETVNGDYTGFFQSIDRVRENASEEYAKNPEELEKVNKAATYLLDEALAGEDDEYEVVDMLYLSNCIYTLLFFLIFSILFKGFTKYGIAIPIAWPRKLHITI